MSETDFSQAHPGEHVPLAGLKDWAREIMAREPDFIIGGAADPYLLRWYVVPRNTWSNVYLHRIVRSDDDRALHDHPWASRSVLIEGCYIEHTPQGKHMRCAGDIIEREAEALHRLEVIPGKPAISLFITGPKVREWGFACPQGWRHWEEFCAGAAPGLMGRGCGE